MIKPATCVLIPGWDSFTAAPLLFKCSLMESVNGPTEQYEGSLYSQRALCEYKHQSRWVNKDFFSDRYIYSPLKENSCWHWCTIFPWLYVYYYSLWVVTYGSFMLCVLTHSLSSWLCATSLLRHTWMWAIIQRMKYVCGGGITFWHKMSLNEISYLPLLWYRTPLNLSVSLYLCSHCASDICSSLCLFVYHTCTQTQVHTCVC